MRNLHREGIRFNTPWFLAILSDLGIDVTPKTDERALRRFLMGEKMLPVQQPTRAMVHRTVNVSSQFDGADCLDSFITGTEGALREALGDNNIDTNDITAIDVAGVDTDGCGTFDVTFMAPETDSELAQRQRYAAIFNQILSKEKQIYSHIDNRAQ